MYFYNFKDIIEFTIGSVIDSILFEKYRIDGFGDRHVIENEGNISTAIGIIFDYENLVIEDFILNDGTIGDYALSISSWFF